MDTSANTAMFGLYTKVVLKHSRRYNGIERVYLPTDKRKGSMALANHYLLQFSLTKRPDLIGPKDHFLASKGNAKDHLKLVQDLATLTQFTVHLVSSSTATRDERHFQLLAATFSFQITKIVPASIVGLEILRRYMLEEEAKSLT